MINGPFKIIALNDKFLIFKRLYVHYTYLPVLSFTVTNTVFGDVENNLQFFHFNAFFNKCISSKSKAYYLNYLNCSS